MNASAETIVAVVQMSSGADVSANLDSAADLLRSAREQGATLAALPENFPLMGERESDKLAIAEEAGAGPIQDFLSSTARSLGLWIVGGTIPLKVPGDPSRVFAACQVYDSAGACVGRYDKVHLFDVDLPRGGGERYRESGSIAPGDVSATCVDSPAGRLGLSVCYDLRFPELYRALVAGNAQLLMVPSAFTERTGQAHWDVLLRSRAIENQCYVVAPNQAGEHPGKRRTWGHSCIIDPWGEVVAQCTTATGVAVAPVSISRLQELRTGFPVLAHRRFKP